MRRDITYVNGITLEEAAEITRHCFFRDDEMELVERQIRNQQDFSNAYGSLINYWKFERCLAEMHSCTGRETFYYYGNCSVCNSPQPFIVDYQFSEDVEGKRVPNWRERLICPNCGCNSRQRFIIHKIFDCYSSDMQILMYEQASNVFEKVKREIPKVKGFEYVGDCRGEQKAIDGIVLEDICELSYMDEEFSLLVSNDVFEHVYDYEKAFLEAYRVLKPGGKLLFTVPFDGNSATTARRVEKDGDGFIYTQSQWYHDCAVAGQAPLLVYQVFGWDILDTLKKCGFSDAYAKVYYGLKEGYMGYLPLYFEAVK